MTQRKWVDSHCHLDYPPMSEDLGGALARAHQAGVGCFLTIGTKLAQAEQVIAIAEAHEDVYCTVGVHPHEAEKQEPEALTDRLIELAAHPKVIGLGETGLDFYYDHAERGMQRRAFEAHIRAAHVTGLPLVVHTRDADAETAEILRKACAEGPLKGLLHCFTSGRELAETALDLGFMISFSGIVTFKKATDLQALVADMPLDRLLVETDAPFLAPVPLRGKANEPAYVIHTAQKIAALKKLDPERLAEATTGNFFRLFDKSARPPALT